MIYSFLKFLAKIIAVVFNKYEVIGELEYNEDERLVLASNHASMIDPIILAISIKPKIHFMGKAELFKNPILNWFFRALNAFPINRQESDLTSLKTAIKKVKENKILGIFIEGTRVKGYDPQNAKSGPILIAKMANAKILPVLIESDYRIFGTTRVYIRDKYELPKFEKTDKSVDNYQLAAEEVLKKIYFG